MAETRTAADVVAQAPVGRDWDDESAHDLLAALAEEAGSEDGEVTFAVVDGMLLSLEVLAETEELVPTNARLRPVEADRG